MVVHIEILTNIGNIFLSSEVSVEILCTFLLPLAKT